MANVIIVVILIFICVFAVISYSKKLSQGCCGAGGDKEKKIRIKDKNVSNYPYYVKIGIEGMTCNHCKMRVENALNSNEGVWAEVDLSKKSAFVRMKKRLSDEELCGIITKAGYAVIEIKS